MSKPTTREIVAKAWRSGLVVPGFNIPYLPMMEPVVRALRDCNSFGLIMVARLEWEKFESGSLRAIRDEYAKVKDENHTRLHLDHIPVIDEDNLQVDYQAIITEALELGYESVMVDGSRLSLADNIAATKAIAQLAHEHEIPAEAELGAVMDTKPDRCRLTRSCSPVKKGSPRRKRPNFLSKNPAATGCRWRSATFTGRFPPPENRRRSRAPELIWSIWHN